MNSHITTEAVNLQTKSVACGAATPEEFVRETDYFSRNLEAAGTDMTPEGIVVEEVVSYFSDPRFQKFSIETEYPIQMGSDNRRADVVLIDSADNADNLVAIAECKRVGVEGQGLDQLRSYLSATDTRFGIFANSTDLGAWDFYENLGGNRVSLMTRSEFEKRVKEENQQDRQSIVSPPGGLYIKRDQPLQYEYTDGTVVPSFNGKPYYSEQNGFACASALRGMPEGLPDHIAVIIRNEQLEIAYSREHLQTEIDSLNDEKAELEAEKRDSESEIASRAEELARKKEDLAGLRVRWHAPEETEFGASQPDEGTSNGSAAELIPLPGEGMPDVSVKPQIEAEVVELIHEKDGLEQERDQKTRELARKREELAGLEVKFQAPTQAELDLPSEAASQMPPKKQVSWLSRIPSGIIASIATIVLAALAIYLFIFYASAVDKAFFLNEEAIQKQVDEGTYAGIQDIVNPAALSKVLQTRNYFVLFFPCIFLGFALAFDHFWESGKRGWGIGLAALTFVFDVLLAIHISRKIYLAEKYIAERTGQTIDPWTLMDTSRILDVFTVIFCGFVASLLVSVLYKVTRERWEQVNPINSQSKELGMHEVQINAEKTQREAEIAVLKTSMENLQSEIDSLNGKVASVKQKLESRQTKVEELSRQQRESDAKAAKLPLNAQIAVLKAEMANLQDEIDLLNEKRRVIQQEIQERQTKIEALLERQHARVIDRDKVESQVSQFVNGWCRYVSSSEVASSQTELTDVVSAKIERIGQVKKDTLDLYFDGLRRPSFQS